MQAVSFLHLSRKDLHTWNSCQVEDRYHKLFQYFQVWQYHLFQLEWSQQHHPEMNIKSNWYIDFFIFFFFGGGGGGFFIYKNLHIEPFNLQLYYKKCLFDFGSGYIGSRYHSRFFVQVGHETIYVSTLISLINVEPTLTDFKKFHPPQYKNPPSTFIEIHSSFIRFMY